MGQKGSERRNSYRTTRLAELEKGSSGWRHRAGGIALSRDIPISLRWIAEPNARRISRNSVATPLRQTQRAVRFRCHTGAERVPQLESSSTVARCGSRALGRSICLIEFGIHLRLGDGPLRGQNRVRIHLTKNVLLKFLDRMELLDRAEIT